MNHVDEYYWIIDHPKIGVPELQGYVEFTPHMVNPETECIEKDKSLNTKPEWWVEFSKLDEICDDFPTHYWELDCGGDTIEEAIDNLYTLVKWRLLIMIEFYPNGGMFLSCTKLIDNCSHLPFCDMRVTKKDDDGCKMVICKGYVKDGVSWREKVNSKTNTRLVKHNE